MELTYEEIKLGLSFLKAPYDDSVTVADMDKITNKCSKLCHAKGVKAQDYFKACVDKAETALWLQEER